MTTQNIPLFPLSLPLFPDSRMPMRIFEVRYLHMIKQCQKDKQPFGIVALRAGTEVLRPEVDESMHSVGCLAHITDVAEVQPGLLMIDTTGGKRFQILASERGSYGLWHGRVTELEPDMAVDIPPDLQPLADKLGALIADAQKQGLEKQLPLTRPYRLDECGWVANQWATLLNVDSAVKVDLLAEDDPLTRLTKVRLMLGE